MIKSILAAASGAACFLLAVGFSWPADAQGTFDCRRPSQSYQRLVCADPGLKAANLRLADTLGEALAVVPNPTALRSEQAEWTQNLRNCSTDVLCLRDFYTDRTSTLRRRITQVAEDQRVVEPAAEEAQPRPTANDPAALDSLPAEDPATGLLNSPDASYVEPEVLPSTADEEADAMTPATTPSTATNPVQAAPTTGSSWSIPPWVMIAAGVSLFLLIGLSIHILNVSAERYGYDMLFNRMAPLHIVVAACIWLSFIVPLLFAPIGLLTFGVILFNNIRRTNFLIGFVGSLIQPIALLLTFMGAKWLATAMKPKR